MIIGALPALCARCAKTAPMCSPCISSLREAFDVSDEAFAFCLAHVPPCGQDYPVCEGDYVLARLRPIQYNIVVFVNMMISMHNCSIWPSLVEFDVCHLRWDLGLQGTCCFPFGLNGQFHPVFGLKQPEDVSLRHESKVAKLAVSETQWLVTPRCTPPFNAPPSRETIEFVGLWSKGTCVDEQRL